MRSSKFWLPAAMRSSAMRPSLTAVTGFVQKPVDESYGQADHVGIRAVDTGDPARGGSLNRIGAGFVHRLAGSRVFGDFAIRHGVEPDGCGGCRESEPPSAAHQAGAGGRGGAGAGEPG